MSKAFASPELAPRTGTQGAVGSVGARLLEGPACYEIADDHCVAELTVASAGRAFELALHVVIDVENATTICWWELGDAIWTTKPGAA